MKSTYEVAILYHPDLEIDIEKAEAKVAKIITDNGGEVTNTESWGKRKTAYPVKGHEHAVYVFYTVSLDGVSVQKVEAMLNITDEVAIAKAAAHKAKRKIPEGETRDLRDSRDSREEKTEE